MVLLERDGLQSLPAPDLIPIVVFEERRQFGGTFIYETLLLHGFEYRSHHAAINLVQFFHFFQASGSLDISACQFLGTDRHAV